MMATKDDEKKGHANMLHVVHAVANRVVSKSSTLRGYLFGGMKTNLNSRWAPLHLWT